MKVIFPLGDPQALNSFLSISHSIKGKSFSSSLEWTGFSKQSCLSAALVKRLMPFLSILMLIKMGSEELPYQSYLM